MKNIFLALVAIGCWLTSCDPPKTPAPCDTIQCAATFQCDNGVCKCPNNTFDVGRTCVTKAATVYYSKSDCACYDTLAIKMPTDSGSFMAKFWMTFPTSFTNPTTPVERYTKRPDGDTFWMYDPFLPQCQINGVSAFPEILGKYSVNKDTIYATIYWHKSYTVVIDSCKKIFVR